MQVINLDIIWAKETYDEVKLKKGQITIDDGEIWLKGQMTSSEWHVFSNAYPANIDLLADFMKCMRYENARLNGRRIKLHVKGAYSFYSHTIRKGFSDLSYKLTELSYSYQCDHDEDYAILDVPFLHLTSKLSNFDHYPEDLLLIKNDSEYRLGPYDTDNRTILFGDVRNIDYLDDLLVHISFYFNLLPNVFMRSVNYNGRTNVSFQTPLFTQPNETLYHSELPYLIIGERNDFIYFFTKSRWNMLDKDNKIKLQNAIYTFARCKYCDDSTQFLLLYAIFDRYVGNSQNTDPYNQMKDNFLYYNIDITRIGKKIDENLRKLQLVLERSSGKKVIVENFCNLRNYILHFMSNAAIDEYISRSNLIDNMRFAVTIIILKELGFNDIKYRSEWNYLSIFND